MESRSETLRATDVVNKGQGDGFSVRADNLQIWLCDRIQLDKRLGITKELKVRYLILKIDADSTVVACRLGGWSHLSPPLRWSLTLMRHHGGNVLKYQECCEIRRVLPLNPMECGFSNVLRGCTRDRDTAKLPIWKPDINVGEHRLPLAVSAHLG